MLALPSVAAAQAPAPRLDFSPDEMALAQGVARDAGRPLGR